VWLRCELWGRRISLANSQMRKPLFTQPCCSRGRLITLERQSRQRMQRAARLLPELDGPASQTLARV
jgi:hypothetical protein